MASRRPVSLICMGREASNENQTQHLYGSMCVASEKRTTSRFLPGWMAPVKHRMENNSLQRSWAILPRHRQTIRRPMSESALIIDDHPLYRDALAQLLRTILSETSVEAASSAGEGLRVAEGLPGLRLVLLDFALPGGMSGTEAITTILRKFPAVVVIAVSASEARRDATAALRAGAKQFIS